MLWKSNKNLNFKYWMLRKPYSLSSIRNEFSSICTQIEMIFRAKKDLLLYDFRSHFRQPDVWKSNNTNPLRNWTHNTFTSESYEKLALRQKVRFDKLCKFHGHTQTHWLEFIADSFIIAFVYSWLFSTVNGTCSCSSFLLML